MRSFYEHARLPAAASCWSDDDWPSDSVPRAEAVYQRRGAVFAFAHVFGARGFASDLFLYASPVAQQVFRLDLSALGMRLQPGGADGVLKAGKLELHPIVVDAGNAVELAAGGCPAQFLGGPPDGRDDVFLLHARRIISENAHFGK